MEQQAGPRLQSNHARDEFTGPVKVSLAWLQRQKSVPVCGGNFHDEWRTTHSLSVRAVQQTMPDGSIHVLIPPGRWIVQFLAVIAAGIALATAVFVPVSLIRQSQSGMMSALSAGGVLGALTARWLIRKRPTVLLTWNPEKNLLTADKGNVRVMVPDIARLILVTGKGAIPLPEHLGTTGTDWDESYGVLLLQRKQAPADEAEFLFRYALPVRPARKAARLASEILQVPLTEWEAGISID